MPLSSKQMEYLALAWQCFESEPKINYEKFRSVAGLASANSARELMRVTKKKLKEEYGASSNGVQDANTGNTTPRTPTTVSPRKRTAPGTGRKSTATKKNSATALANAEASDDDDDVESPVTKKKKVVVRADSAAPVKIEAEEDGDIFM